MKTYRDLYYYLFGITEDALNAMEQQNFGTARELLIQGQKTAEAAFTSDEFLEEQEPDEV